MRFTPEKPVKLRGIGTPKTGQTTRDRTLFKIFSLNQVFEDPVVLNFLLMLYHQDRGDQKFKQDIFELLPLTEGEFRVSSSDVDFTMKGAEFVLEKMRGLPVVKPDGTAPYSPPKSFALMCRAVREGAMQMLPKGKAK